jgi:hypothetical protein
MPTKKQNALERKAERIALNPKRPILTKEEVLEIVFAKARLVLRLKAPNDILDHAEFVALRKRQTAQIEQFVNLLEECLVNELGSVTVAVYASE